MEDQTPEITNDLGSVGTRMNQSQNNGNSVHFNLEDLVIHEEDEEKESKLDVHRVMPLSSEQDLMPQKRESGGPSSVFSVGSKQSKPLNIMSVSPTLEKGGSYDPYVDVSTANLISQNRRGLRNEPDVSYFGKEYNTIQPMGKSVSVSPYNPSDNHIVSQAYDLKPKSRIPNATPFRTIDTTNPVKTAFSQRSNISPRSFAPDHQLMMAELQGYRQTGKSQIVGSPSKSRITSGQSLHNSVMQRKTTKKWDLGEGAKGNLSYKKMRATVNQKHPRVIKDGQPRPMPLCINTGRLMNSSNKEQYGLDDLGMGVSIYFKLLKSMIFFFIFCSIISAPLYFFYSSGDTSKQATGSIQMHLSELSLGNLGESSFMCFQRNVKVFSSINLWCPSGTKISKLQKFGIQANDTSALDNNCPQTIDEGSSGDNQLRLTLDEQCSLEGMRKEFPYYYGNFTNQFNKLCLNKQECDMLIQNVKWPQPCQEKIGFRLEVITIQKTKIVEITADADELDLLEGIENNGTATNSSEPAGGQDETSSNCTSNSSTADSNSTSLNGTSEANPCVPVEEEEEQTVTVVSTVTQLEQAYEWYVDNENVPHYFYAVIECTNQEIELNVLDGLSISRKALGLWTVAIDFFIMLCFLISLWTLTFFVKVDSERHRSLFFETKEFSVMIGNLPKLNSEFTIEQLKAELWDHVHKIIREQPQQINKLAASEEVRACEIIDIQFAMSDYQYLEDVVQIKKLSQEIEKLDLKIEEAKSAQKIEKLSKKKARLLETIDDHKHRYFSNLEKMGQDNQAITAFVVFRSMEGVERAIVGFESWRLSRSLYNTFGWASHRQHSRIFKKKWLKVERGIEPDLLIWENFGVSSFSRFLRIIFYILFVLCMLVVCFYIILQLERRSNVAEEQVPDILCPDQVDAFVAEVDYKAQIGERSGDFHCFCKSLFFSKGFEGVQNFLFPQSGENLCSQWFNHYLTVLMIIGGIALLINAGNVAVELLIQKGSKLTRPVNQQQILTKAVRAISWIQLINLGLILFVINMSLKLGKIILPDGILQGDYEDITSMWYLDVGTQIIISMVLEILAPHFVPLTSFFWHKARRCFDRGCSLDDRRSKKLLQQEYEELYIGPEFSLDARLAQMVAFVWTTFMYSSGLPVLFLISMINFVIMYWIDKFLLLRFYRTPKNYDETCIYFSLGEMKYSFVFHFFFGALIFSNNKILSGQDEVFDINAPGFSSLFDLTRFSSLHVILFLVGNLLLILLSVFESTIFRHLKSLVCWGDAQESFENMDALSDDYYEVIGLRFLISEYERAKHEKQNYLLYIEGLKNTSQFIIKSQILNKHIKRLKEKEKTIQSKINSLCRLIDVQEPTIAEKVRVLQINVEKLMSKKHYRIKSKVQSYDIRDCDEYYGILELESLLKKTGRHIEVELDEIFRSTSKVLQVGTSLSKSGSKIGENGHLVHVNSQSDSMPLSDLDDILLDDNKKDPIQELVNVLGEETHNGTSSMAKTQTEDGSVVHLKTRKSSVEVGTFIEAKQTISAGPTAIKKAPLTQQMSKFKVGQVLSIVEQEKNQSEVRMQPQDQSLESEEVPSPSFV